MAEEDNNNPSLHSTELFINSLKEELNNGYSFTPILGSSISYQSGVMTSEEIADYMCYVYYRMFIVDPKIDPDNKWDILKQGWPEPPNEEEKNRCREKLKKEYLNLYNKDDVEKNFITDTEELILDYENEEYNPDLKLYPCPHIVFQTDEFKKELINIPKNTDIKDNENPHLYARRLGLLQIERTKNAIEFFSRIRANTKNEEYRIDQEEDPNIFISFKIFLTKNKKPNQNHHLICHLSNPLRFRKIFTTNIDSLLEDAFYKNMSPLNTRTILNIDQIPEVNFIEGTSLVKINIVNPNKNEVYKPDEEDKNIETLSSYFKNTHGNIISHILTIGNFTNNDKILRRISAILKENEEIKLFSICSSEKEKKSIKKKLIKGVESDETAKESFNRRIFLARERDPSFFLYEIYQKITLALPPGGFFYQYDQFKPPIFKNNTPENKSFGVVKESEIINLYGEQSVAKASSSLFYHQIKQAHKSIWLEIEDYCNPTDFYTNFFRAIFYQLGIIHQEHTLIEMPTEKDTEIKLSHKIQSYINYLRINPKNWTLFIYAENKPGACSGLTEPPAEKVLFGIKDLKIFIETINNKGFNVVISTKKNESKHFEKIQAIKIEKNMSITVLNRMLTSFTKNSNTAIKDKLDLHIHDICEDDTIKTNNTIDETTIKRCIYISTLLRQSRSINVFFSEAFFPRLGTNNTFEQDNTAKNELAISYIIKQLEDFGVCSTKPGGYIWINGDLRNTLTEKYKENIHNNKTFDSQKSESHFCIGNWYFQAFLSSSNPSPLTEAFYHWFTAINNELSLINEKSGQHNIEDHFIILASCFGELCKGARLASKFVKHWMYDKNGTLNFSKENILQALNPEENINIGKIDIIFGASEIKKNDDYHKYIIALIKDFLIQSRNIETELRHESGYSIIRSTKMDTFGVLDKQKPKFLNIDQDIEIDYFSLNKKNNGSIIEEIEDKFNSRILEDFGLQQDRISILNVFKIIRKHINEAAKKDLNNPKVLQDTVKKLKLKFRAAKEKTIFDFFNEPYILIASIKFYSSASYILIKHLKTLKYHKDYKDSKITVIYWLSISSICTHCLDLLKVFWPKYHTDEISLKPKCLSMNALALAHLNQFHEAQRNINYSTSWNFNFGERQSLVSLASITIRQAEIHLLEADFIGDKLNSDVNQFRRFITKLDDCYTTLEKAENIMSASNHSSLWWGRLHILKLKLYGNCNVKNMEINELYPIIYSKKIDHSHKINDIFRKGIILASKNYIQKIILLESYINAAQQLSMKKEDLTNHLRLTLNIPESVEFNAKTLKIFTHESHRKENMPEEIQAMLDKAIEEISTNDNSPKDTEQKSQLLAEEC